MDIEGPSNFEQVNFLWLLLQLNIATWYSSFILQTRLIHNSYLRYKSN